MNPDQTAPIGAVCFGSTQFVSILNLSVMLGNFFAADDFSRRHFQMHFFLGALRVNQNRLPADDSHEIPCLITTTKKQQQNLKLSSAANHRWRLKGYI